MTGIFSFPAKITCLTAAVAILASVSVACAQQSFKSPEDAAEALVNAAKNNWPKGVIAVLGPDADEIAFAAFFNSPSIRSRSSARS